MRQQRSISLVREWSRLYLMALRVFQERYTSDLLRTCDYWGSVRDRFPWKFFGLGSVRDRFPWKFFGLGSVRDRFPWKFFGLKHFHTKQLLDFSTWREKNVLHSFTKIFKSRQCDLKRDFWLKLVTNHLHFYSLPFL